MALGAPQVVAQTVRDPSWTAEVGLACPDGNVTERTVTLFTPRVDAGQTALLSLATFDPANGGFRLEPVGVGSVVRVAVVANNGSSNSPQLQWGIVGVQLGPWPIDSLRDTCPLAETGSGSGPLLLIVGSTLAAAGLVAIGLTRRRPRSAA